MLSEAHRWWIKNNDAQTRFKVVNNQYVTAKQRKTRENKMVERTKNKEFVNVSHFDGVLEAVEIVDKEKDGKTFSQLKMVFGSLDQDNLNYLQKNKVDSEK